MWVNSAYKWADGGLLDTMFETGWGEVPSSCLLEVIDYTHISAWLLKSAKKKQIFLQLYIFDRKLLLW